MPMHPCRVSLALLALALLSQACGRADAPHVERAAEARIALRDDARLVLEARCGQCHIGSYPTALPRALAVYDLEETEWSARMTPAQHREALRRIDLGLGPEGEDLGVTDEERARVHAFLDAELLNE
jgi:hypothetical protein